MATKKSAVAKKSATAKKSAPKKAAAKKTGKKSTAKDAAPEVSNPAPELRDSSAPATTVEKVIDKHKKAVWNELGVPRDRRGENLHEQNPDLQASINSKTVRTLDKSLQEKNAEG